MLFSQSQSINIIYPNVKDPFRLVCRKNNLDSCIKWSLSHYEHELWSLAKQRVQILFSQNQSINIVYPKANNLFPFVRRQKNLDSFYKQSASHFEDELWYPEKTKDLNAFLTKAKLQNRVLQC